MLRELIRARIFQASKHSRITFEDSITNDQLWSIVSVHPEPVVSPATTASGDLEESELIEGSELIAAARLNQEILSANATLVY